MHQEEKLEEQVEWIDYPLPCADEYTESDYRYDPN